MNHEQIKLRLWTHEQLAAEVERLREVFTDCPKLHRRKCWSCKNTAWHSRDITPEVLCSKCGSQDTRRVKWEPTP